MPLLDLHHRRRSMCLQVGDDQVAVLPLSFYLTFSIQVHLRLKHFSRSQMSRVTSGREAVTTQISPYLNIMIMTSWWKLQCQLCVAQVLRIAPSGRSRYDETYGGTPSRHSFYDSSGRNGHCNM